MDLSECPCQEASPLSRETFIPCGAPGSKLVWHQKDRRAYVMCAPCADHNITNRGGVPLQAEEVDAGVAPGVDDLTIPVSPEEEDEMETVLHFTVTYVGGYLATLGRKTELFKGEEMVPMALAFFRGCLNGMIGVISTASTDEQKAVTTQFETEAEKLTVADMQGFFNADFDKTD